MQHGAPKIGKLGPLIVHSIIRFSGLTALQTVTQWPSAGCSNRAKTIWTFHGAWAAVHRFHRSQEANGHQRYCVVPIQASRIGNLLCIVAVVARSEFGLFVLPNSPPAIAFPRQLAIALQ